MTDERWLDLVEAAEGGHVTQGTMFGSKGLRTGTKFFAIWWHEQLVVKLPPARLTELVEAGDGQPFEPMEGRRMNGWLVVAPAADWDELVGEARTHVEAQQR
ncbi:TfoX/Sxy family protein [Blastococcus sp. CT_GayMR16]|uniref:TfoX/Sxy family protein n=1 Tax=Blastococcus sp. CT_GayMR16 TaxID=2559607 RepID=UPI0010741D33|nr:TfoX/Sxy family protein [Blastococcus sp. CT_GayMR16]TFV88219.1 MmcQ/YjbR family DNA-binding protein [Blastococcus sp. CT_GayMR16]